MSGDRATYARRATGEIVPTQPVGTGTAVARGIGWREIEITRAPDGRPDVRLSGTAAERARELGVGRVLLSLSHTHLAAVAVVVLERV